MANMLDTATVRNIAKHRNKLMSLVETTKRRKAKKQKKWAVPPSNIEHLVFKKIPTSPPGVGSPSGDDSAVNGTTAKSEDDDDYEEDDREVEYNSGADEDDSERELTDCPSKRPTPPMVLSDELRDQHVLYRSKLLVVTEDDPSTAGRNKKDVTTTTTTFGSSSHNGVRSTNTICVRYKFPWSNDPSSQAKRGHKVDPSTPTLPDSELPAKMESVCTSAWAQIMELEGYRSPAVGLDSCQTECSPAERKTSPSGLANWSSSAHRNEEQPANKSPLGKVVPQSDSLCPKPSFIGISVRPPAGGEHYSSSAKTSKLSDVHNGNDCIREDWVDSVNGSSGRSSCSSTLGIPAVNAGVATPSVYYSCNSPDTVAIRTTRTDKDVSPRNLGLSVVKNSNGSRHVSKLRRKTLPDGQLLVNAERNPVSVASVKHHSSMKTCKDLNSDPNASWGRYNSRAMRESAHKVAEQYEKLASRNRREPMPSLKETVQVPETSTLSRPTSENVPEYREACIPNSVTLLSSVAAIRKVENGRGSISNRSSSSSQEMSDSISPQPSSSSPVTSGEDAASPGPPGLPGKLPQLCESCFKSTEGGPPLKQPSCRTRYPQIEPSKTGSVNGTSQQSFIATLKADNAYEWRQDNAKICAENGYLAQHGMGPSSRNLGSFSEVTAKELSDLVNAQGSSSHSSERKKFPFISASTMTSWLQKQKEKRKPSMASEAGEHCPLLSEQLVGDPEKTLDCLSKRSTSLKNYCHERKADGRSLRYSSVTDLKSVYDQRAGEGTAVTDKFSSGEGDASTRVKRASSSCGRAVTVTSDGSLSNSYRNGYSISREGLGPKTLQGRQHSNGLLGGRTPGERLSVSSATDEFDFGSRGPSTIFGTHFTKKTSKGQETNSFSTPRWPRICETEAVSYSPCPDDFSSSSRCPVNRRRSSSSTVPDSEIDSSCRDKPMLVRKLLNFGPISRALSLHSLKKKSKSSLPSDYPETHSTREVLKADSVIGPRQGKDAGTAFGSLRKCISYAELSTSISKSGSSSFEPSYSPPEPQEVKQSLECSFVTDKSSVAKNLRRSSSKPTRSTRCMCFFGLRRSSSLPRWFPLRKRPHLPYPVAPTRCISRISCAPRRNSSLGSSPCKPVVNFVSKESCDNNGDVGDRVSSDFKDILKEPVLDTVSKDITPILAKKNRGSRSEQIRPAGTCDVLNESETQPSSENAEPIMGLGSNHVADTPEELRNGKMDECQEVADISLDSGESCVPPRIAKQLSPILRLRNRTMSKSERNARGKSSSEIGKRSVRKTVSDSVDAKKRPTSQFYVSDDEFFAKSDSQNLVRMNSVTSGSQPILSASTDTSGAQDDSSGFQSNYMNLRTSSPHLSTVSSILQIFRKSFVLKFQKKKQELSTSCDSEAVDPAPVLNGHHEPNTSETPVVSQPVALPTGESSGKTVSPKNFHSSVLRTMRDRKASRRRSDGRAMSLFCDDLVTSGESTDASSKSLLTNCPTGSDANLLRKRAASTSDYSPKSKSVQRPFSVIDSFAVDGTPSSKATEERQDSLRETPGTDTSNYGGSKDFLGSDLAWRTNPVKLCRVHSRLLMCRHKGRYRLRRSISQPIELESLGSVHNLQGSTQGLTDQDNFQKCSSSDDDAASSDSDLYHSFCCSPTRRSNTCWELSSEGGIFAEALWDHETSDSEELPFQAGDLIEVTDTSDQEWWWGTRAGRSGWFPSAFVRLYINHRGPSSNFSSQQSDNVQTRCSPCKTNISNLSCEQVRANIVQEIVATERDYVKHLKDVVEGYLKQVQRRPDMFSKERIDTVFGNIKEIYEFQSRFLKELEQCLNKDSLHLSQIGNCFLQNKESFKMYSEYCNNHPLAVSELQELYCESQYIHFFEACRLLQEMIDISLDGFLLTPIQRICKYPLQLAELLKFTEVTHPDHVPVSKALAAMREVAELVNERKRRMECLERLAEWQNTIEGWEGSDLLDTSSILIHCGEVTRVTSSWSRDVYIFIFDHLLVYCKKDLLKRHTYAYKGRLNLDYCDIVDIEDGKDPQFALNVKNAWKVYCRAKEKWYLFYAKTASEKEQWIEAFKMERKRVTDDKEQGFVVTEEAKKAARTAVQNKQKPKRPRAKFNKGRRCHPDVAVTELMLEPSSAKSRTGSLPSNIHPELAIMAGAKMGPPRKKGSGWFHFGSGKKPKS